MNKASRLKWKTMVVQKSKAGFEAQSFRKVATPLICFFLDSRSGSRTSSCPRTRPRFRLKLRPCSRSKESSKDSDLSLASRRLSNIRFVSQGQTVSKIIASVALKPCDPKSTLTSQKILTLDPSTNLHACTPLTPESVTTSIALEH